MNPAFQYPPYPPPPHQPPPQYDPRMWPQNQSHPPFLNYDDVNNRIQNPYLPTDRQNPLFLDKGTPHRPAGDATNQLNNQYLNSNSGLNTGDATNQYKQFLNEGSSQRKPDIVLTNSKVLSPENQRKSKEEEVNEM